MTQGFHIWVLGQKKHQHSMIFQMINVALKCVQNIDVLAHFKGKAFLDEKVDHARHFVEASSC